MKCTARVLAFLPAKLGGGKSFGVLQRCALILSIRKMLYLLFFSISDGNMYQPALLQDLKESDACWGVPVPVLLNRNAHMQWPYARGSGVPAWTGWCYSSDWTARFPEITEKSSEPVPIMQAE